MTLQEVLSTTDELKANMMSEATKIRFISEIEGRVHQEILMKHEHTEEEETLPVYDDNTDPSTMMLVPAPYDMLYVYWLMSKIDMLNQEPEKEYNNMARFEKAYGELCDYWRREHMPITPVQQFYF